MSTFSHTKTNETKIEDARPPENKLQPRRALGKGLDSLLPSKPTQAGSAALTITPADEIGSGNERNANGPARLESGGLEAAAQQIPIHLIDVNPQQTRRNVDESRLDELAASIAVHGVLQPIMVRPQPNGRYEIVAGERRFLASRKANKETIPAVVRPVSNGQALEMTIVENLQREDLDPIEQACAFEALSTDFGLTQEEIAQRTGKDRATVANFLRLLRLPRPVQEMVISGQLTMGHAKALLILGDGHAMHMAAVVILGRELSVRKAEEYVKSLMVPMDRPRVNITAKAVDPNVREAAERLQSAMGMKVLIEDRKGRGRVIFEYSGLDDFDRLLDAVLGSGNSPL